MNEQALTLEQIHQGTLEILKKIIVICDELHINYYMAYGTLLGAVRHQGFIPWDDDLDILMLRPDYDKFVDYCYANEAALFPLKLMGPDNTPDYPFNVWRFCDLRYRMESEEVSDAGMGMFIDVYCLDGAGNDPEEAVRKIGKQKWFYTSSLLSAVHPRYSPSTRGILGNLVKFPGYCLAKLLGARFFQNRLLKLKDTFSLEDSQYVVNMIWEWPMKPNLKAHYQSYTYLPFEGIQVKVPVAYDTVLRNSYGDYMVLPPEDKRAPHHAYSLYRKPEYFA